MAPPFGFPLKSTRKWSLAREETKGSPKWCFATVANLGHGAGSLAHLNHNSLGSSRHEQVQNSDMVQAYQPKTM